MNWLMSKRARSSCILPLRPCWKQNRLRVSRPPSVRVDHGYSILIVCLAGASATMTVKANAWMAVPAASAARVCCLLDIADTKFSAGPPPCGSLCQLLFSCFEVPCNGSSPLWPISCEIFPGLCVNSYSLHVTLQSISVSQLWASSASTSSG